MVSRWAAAASAFAMSPRKYTLEEATEVIGPGSMRMRTVPSAGAAAPPGVAGSRPTLICGEKWRSLGGLLDRLRVELQLRVLFRDNFLYLWP